MVIRYLLDTNMVSYIVRGNPPAVRERLSRLHQDEVAISVMTEAELHFGVERAPEAGRLNFLIEQFLFQVPSIAWNSAAARQYGALRSRLQAAGTTMGNMDMIIAAHALAFDAILVTHDLAFRRVPHLKLEDWTLPFRKHS